MFIFKLVVLLVIQTSGSSESVYYVKPDNSSSGCPPLQSCLTLDQYAAQQSNFFSTNSTFLFLPGYHHTHTLILLRNVSDILLSGIGTDPALFNTDMNIRCEEVSHLLIQTMRLAFTGNSSSVLIFINSENVLIFDIIFEGISDATKYLTRAIVFYQSNSFIESCTFEGNSGFNGGAIGIERSNVSIYRTVFFKNTAKLSGGAIFALQSELLIKKSYFIGNFAKQGGAIKCQHCQLAVLSAEFVSNTAQLGGAVVHFTENATSTDTWISSSVLNYFKSELYILKGRSHTAKHLSRAIKYNISNAFIENCTFEGNYGINGGAIYIERSKISISETTFVKNGAKITGGAISALQSRLVIKGTSLGSNFAKQGGGINCFFSCHLTASSTVFVSNMAQVGGAAVHLRNNATYNNVNVTGNSGSGLFISGSSVEFVGNTTMNGNISPVGGALRVQVSTVTFTGCTLFQDNYASIEGGAIAGAVFVTFSFSGITTFVNNSATKLVGGAVFASLHTTLLVNGSILFKQNKCTSCFGGAICLEGESRIVVFSSITFDSNWALSGGAILLGRSYIAMKQQSEIVTLNNHAKYLGGAIFHDDIISHFQCNYDMGTSYPKGTKLIGLPDCFLKLENFKFNKSSNFFYRIHSYNNTAGLDGDFLFGGLTDKCIVIDTNERVVHYDLLYNVLSDYHILHIETSTDGNNAISSEAYTLCFCMNEHEYNCTATKVLSTYRGSKFSVSLLALSQGNTIIASVLLADISKTARLGLDQNSKNLTANCTTVYYNIYSTMEMEQLALFPDGDCRDQGLAVARVTVNFLPCPEGFILSGDHCVCEERLQEYGAECTVFDNDNFITKRGRSKFWLGYTNDSGQAGLILYKSCPVGYCKSVDVNISLSDLDIQCDYNRSGTLCGACAANYSLMLGNSRCEECSNMYLLLLIAFAAAGVLLVVFLSVLRLTVVLGTLNSVILYANIVQANKENFFPDSRTNVLTVFIAWMNLDLGLPTCFYHGMDAYTQTWLQFVFPVYVWVLISLIIITSRYSAFITRLIGTNPIAVLATLLLMSYTKLLKTIIQIYLSAELDYPEDKTVTVWLKDATVPYLKSHHLLLAVAGSVFIALFFLPYTKLLLLGYKLYRFSGNGLIGWFMIKMKPLLDSYYAPYENHTRYWTGLQLVVRCALYSVFSYNSIGKTGNSLLAIIIVFTALIVIAWLSVRIYKSFFVNVVEALVYLNLIILSAVTAIKNKNYQALINLLVAMIFVITIGTILYQLYTLYIAKSTVWQKVTSKLIGFIAKARRNLKRETEEERAPLVSSTPREGVVTSTVVAISDVLSDEHSH